MESYIVLGLLLGGPLLLGIFMLVGAPHLFFALMAGELLERYFGAEIQSGLAASTDNEIILGYTKIAVMVLPVLLTAIFFRKSLKKSKSILHIIPWLATGLVFAAFAAPLLPLESQANLQQTTAGAWIMESTSLIVGSMVILQLVYAWTLHNPKHEEHHKKGKKKH